MTIEPIAPAAQADPLSYGAPLQRYDAARRALAEAHRVDEVKEIRDKAVAMQAYAKQAKDTALITQATEIRMRAERRAGELLREMAERNERHDGSNKQNLRGSHAATPVVPKLADLGINKTQSSRWQTLAALDADAFEEKLESASKRAYDGIARPSRPFCAARRRPPDDSCDQTNKSITARHGDRAATAL